VSEGDGIAPLKYETGEKEKNNKLLLRETMKTSINIALGGEPGALERVRP
jgi:hypothetical protein